MTSCTCMYEQFPAPKLDFIDKSTHQLFYYSHVTYPSSNENHQEQPFMCICRSSRSQMFFKIEPCNFIKKRLQQRCLTVNTAKFLRTTFLQNITNGCFCMCFKIAFKVLQNSQETTCNVILFPVKLKALCFNITNKEILDRFFLVNFGKPFSQNTFWRLLVNFLNFLKFYEIF